jgi:sister-chromatid-cohesion protein PDS5
MPKAARSMQYPPGCKEISEDLPTDDLVRRIKEIAMAFQQMSQEDDNSCYLTLAKFLATDYFLDHQSRDVRLLVACAIADVFRVYAPNAPYQEADLIKRIFLFFIQQLKGLQDPKDPVFKRYFYLLENLAWVKSFNICIELEDSQTIFCQLFALLFRIVNDNHSEKVKNFMLDMLTPLILEADTVSQKLIEIILWQVIDPKKTHHKQAAWLATQILKKTSKTMEPYLITYFNNAIQHGVNGSAGDLSDEEPDDETTPANVSKTRNRVMRAKNATQQTSVTQLCELIYELNQICPSVMDGILPQLEYKIRSNDEKERCEFTKLLARLFSDKNSNLAEQYPDLWKCFLGRFRDISITVRMRCVQYSMHFLVNHPELKTDITEQLKQRQHDPDENVRYEVVMAIISAARKGIEHINEDLLSYVKERTLDKKFKIRREALFGMAQLYKLNNVANMPADDSGDLPASATASLRMLNWIKNKCLHNYFQSQLEDRLLVERILHTCLIPYSQPLPERMQSIYTFYCSVDANAARAFNELLRQQLAVRKQVKEIIDLLKEEKTEERDLNLKIKIGSCAKNLPEPVKADEYITKLCRNLELNPALRQHMEIIVTSTSYVQVSEDGTMVPPPNCGSIELSTKEVLKSLGFPVQTNSFYVIIKQLMERIAPVLLDHTGLLILFDFVSDSLLGDGEKDQRMGIENSARRGLQLILALSSVFPAIFYGREIFTDYLLPFLWQSSDHPEIAEVVLQILTNIGCTAGTQSVVRSDGTSSLTSIPWWATDEETIPRIIDRFVLKSTSTKQSKYAIQCLNAIITDDSEKMKIFSQIMDQIKATGLSLDSLFFRNHLVTIGMVATCGGNVFFPKLLRTIIQKFVVQNLLLKDQRLQEEIEQQEETEKQREISDPALNYDFCSEEVKCKVEGIKLMVRWLYGMKHNTITAAIEQQSEVILQYQKVASNTLQLLKTLIENGGDLNDNGCGGTTLEKAYLRLAAGSAMLKIAANDSITSITTNNGETTIVAASSSATSTVMLPAQWHTLSTLLLDPQEFVREKFAQKLHKGLVSLALGLEFLATLSLGGTFEAASPMRHKLKSYLLLNIAKRRDLVKSKCVVNLKATMPDCVMPYVIHLLAHMPFYTQYDDVAQLETVKGQFCCLLSCSRSLSDTCFSRLLVVRDGAAGPKE